LLTFYAKDSPNKPSRDRRYHLQTRQINFALWHCQRLNSLCMHDKALRQCRGRWFKVTTQMPELKTYPTAISFSTNVAPGADHAAAPANSRAFHVVTYPVNFTLPS
jgi:hypothetical protein